MAALTNRLNSLLLVLVLLALLTIIGMLGAGVRGGPLDPPGPPGSTDSVRLPGTPISSIPFTINEPGNYYVTRDLWSPFNVNGIVVNADDVTIDLMGFTISGPTGFDTAVGIKESGGNRHFVKIRNGVLRDWGIAISMGSARGTSIDEMRIVENFNGIQVGTGGVLSDLVVRDNGATGIDVHQYPNEYGTEIRDSIISNNGEFGIFISANNVWIHDNLIDANHSDGIQLYFNASWNKITDNRIGGNAYGVAINSAGLGQPNVNMVARNQIVGNHSGAVFDTGAGNRIGVFVGGDASISGSNPWSNVVY